MFCILPTADWQRPDSPNLIKSGDMHGAPCLRLQPLHRESVLSPFSLSKNCRIWHTRLSSWQGIDCRVEVMPVTQPAVSGAGHDTVNQPHAVQRTVDEYSLDPQELIIYIWHITTVEAPKHVTWKGAHVNTSRWIDSSLPAGRTLYASGSWAKMATDICVCMYIFI